MEELVRFEYEVLGLTFEELASRHGHSAEVFKAMAIEEGWQRKVNEIPVPTVASLGELADQLGLVNQQRLSLIEGHRQLALQPLYVKVEQLLLTKAAEILEALPVTDPHTASQAIERLTRAISKMQERETLQYSIKKSLAEANAQGKGELSFEILGNV
jgi:hypothetical protein